MGGTLTWMLVLDLGWSGMVGLQSSLAFWDDEGQVVERRMDIQRVAAGIWGYGLDEGYVDWGVYLQGMCFKIDTASTCSGEWVALQYSRALPFADQMILLRFLLGWDLFQHPYQMRALQHTSSSVNQSWLDRFQNYRQGAAFLGLSSRWLFTTDPAHRFFAGLDVLFNFPEGQIGRETRLYGFLEGSIGERVGAGVRMGMAYQAAEDLGTWLLEDSLGNQDTVEIQLPSSRVFYAVPYVFARTDFGEVRLWFGLPGRIPYTVEGPGFAGMGMPRQTWGLSLEVIKSPLFAEFRRGRWK